MHSLAHVMSTRFYIFEYNFNKMENSTYGVIISWSGRVGSGRIRETGPVDISDNDSCVFVCSCVRGVRLRTLDCWKAMRYWQ